MQYKNVLLFSFSVAVFLGASTALAQVNRTSIFHEARNPASELDIKLSEIQARWLLAYIISPDAATRKQHSLITRVGAAVELRYSALYDRIFAYARVHNADEFLSLSEKERKQLVSNLLELLWEQLFTSASVDDKKKGRSPLDKRHIRLSVRMNDITKNDKNELIGFIIPSEIGVGQAGYKDGQFVYSESYFLRLKVSEGRAKSGDATKFVIEREP